MEEKLVQRIKDLEEYYNDRAVELCELSNLPCEYTQYDIESEKCNAVHEALAIILSFIEGVEELTGENSEHEMFFRMVGDLGRIFIPASLRKRIGIIEGEKMKVYADEAGRIILEKMKEESHK